VVPVGLTQVYWDTGDRQVISWDTIHKLAAEQDGTNVEDDGTTRVFNVVVNATSVEEDNHNTSREAKSSKLAKLVRLAKSTALWCLSPYIPLMQEAKDKQRKVCPVNLRGEVCTASNCGSKHPKVCLVADHDKGKIPKATCLLWHMRVPFTIKSQGSFTGRRSGPKSPPRNKGNNSNNARPAKPDKYLVKLEAEYRAEELKARIRAQKMMLQGFTCSQVVEGPAVPPRRALAHVTPHVNPAPAPAQVHVPRVLRTALTQDKAIAIFEDTIERLRLRPPQQ
jgi:hypothetical protein